ncbi:MAG: hypothetical protein FWD98_03070 [Defluviitaleaceae bacterium]|nr:hypothetical protein [Defluviitaleaceae bacterium]
MFHIIVNPTAGNGRGLVRAAHLAGLFESGGVEYSLTQTNAPLHARDLARQICAGGSRGIIGIGGDGTMQEIAAGIAAASEGRAEISTPLAVFPGGSGNDFVLTAEGIHAARTYGTRNHAAAALAVCNRVLRGEVSRIDLLTANGTAFLNIGNMGIDSLIVANAMRHKRRLGRYAYLAAVYSSILEYESLPLTLTIDGEVSHGRYTLAAICNGQFYGGGMHIAPMADLRDGRITLCLVQAMSRPRTMMIFPSLLLRQHHRLREVCFVQCSSFTLNTPDPQKLCLDGNLYEHSSDITFRVKPRAMPIFI